MRVVCLLPFKLQEQPHRCLKGKTGLEPKAQQVHPLSPTALEPGGTGRQAVGRGSELAALGKPNQPDHWARFPIGWGLN